MHTNIYKSHETIDQLYLDTMSALSAHLSIRYLFYSMPHSSYSPNICNKQPPAVYPHPDPAKPRGRGL